MIPKRVCRPNSRLSTEGDGVGVMENPKRRKNTPRTIAMTIIRTFIIKIDVTMPYFGKQFVLRISQI